MTARDSSPGVEPITVQGLVRLGPKRSLVAQVRETPGPDGRPARPGAGDDSAPTPPEYLALALAGCVLNMSRSLAEARGLPPENLTATVAGIIDPAKAFGLASEVRAGFQDFTVTIGGTEGWPQSGRSFLLEALKERCPVCDNLTNPTGVRFRLGRETDVSGG